MWGDIEQSPVLAAPSFNNFIGLAANSTNPKIGEKDGKVQGDEANDLCERYRKLAYKIASRYRGKGIPLDDLRSAGLSGLVKASRKFDPARGAFGAYAELWIKGELTRLFKPGGDALGFGRAKSLNAPVFNDDDGEADPQAIDLVIDERAPTVSLDVSNLTERERRVFLGHSEGETLGELGSELGLTPERIRQVYVRAAERVSATRANVALTCIRDLHKGYEANPKSERRKPNLHYQRRPSAGHTYTQEEKEEFIATRPDLLSPITEEERIVRLRRRWFLEDWWGHTIPNRYPFPKRTNQEPKINRDGYWRSLKRAGERSPVEEEARCAVKMIRLNESLRLAWIRGGAAQ
jgi:RNA polymerase sigma factor (sigma-70 family)